jgi:hypothetical protein
MAEEPNDKIIPLRRRDAEEIRWKAIHLIGGYLHLKI